MYESDLKWVYNARNHVYVRSASGSSKRISFREHRVWFDCSTDSIKLVFTEDEKRLGVVIYDGRGYWSFYLDPNSNRSLGRGLGRLMLSLALVYLKKRKVKKIKALILETNEISYRIHKSLGFEPLMANKQQIGMQKEL